MTNSPAEQLPNKTKYSWRKLLECGRWIKQADGCYRRGQQRIVRHTIRAKWLFYPDLRSDREFVFR